MRHWIVLLALGALLAMPCRAPAGASDDEPTEDENVEGWEALRDLEQAETDEEKNDAMERFEDASERGLQKQREKLNEALER